MKLFEVQQKTKTKTATDDVDLSAYERQQKVHAPVKSTEKRDLSRKTAQKYATRRAAATANMPAGAAEKFAAMDNLDITDKVSDAEARQDEPGFEPETESKSLAIPKNLPKIINKEIAADYPIEPEWHMVRNLPGYMKQAIRAMGRQIFDMYTKTELEDIQVLAHVGGGGPNSKQEMNAGAAWLRDNAHEDTHAQLDFEQSIPDYKAEVKMYTALGFSFLVVRDFAGEYIYSWPSKDNKGDHSVPKALK